jgi:hypothetical protein
VIVLFCDSSALVKRYLSEIGSAWLTAQVDPSNGNSVIVAEITRVEIAAAPASRQRATGGISILERDKLFRLLIKHVADEYKTTPLNVPIVDQAMLLTQRHRLRGYGAVQLATALLVNEQLIANTGAALTFVTADDDLIEAAQAKGLATENPNEHP